MVGMTTEEFEHGHDILKSDPSYGVRGEPWMRAKPRQELTKVSKDKTLQRTAMQ